MVISSVALDGLPRRSCPLPCSLPYYQQPDQLPGPLPVSFTRHLASGLKDHRFTFTRGDLSRENSTMKRVDNLFSNTGEYPVAAIVDWETAG